MAGFSSGRGATGIEIRHEVDDGLSAAIGRAIAAGTDMTPAMMEIASHLESTHRLRFETSTGPDGRKWKPSQRALEEGGKTLVLTTDLQTSVKADYGPTFAAVGPERSFGAAVYAAIHQFGGVIRPKVKKALSFGGRVLAKVTIPPRPYVGFDQVNRDTIARILTDFLRGAFAPGAAPGGAQGNAP